MAPHRFHSLEHWFPNQTVIPLWPECEAPNSLNPSFVERSTEPSKPDRALSEVTSPELLVFKPDTPNGIGILILPGGGYERLAFDSEGADTARWLVQHGYTAFVLSYRLPHGAHTEGRMAPLVDVQKAMSLIRSMRLNRPFNQLGVMGFSAGGHLAGLYTNECAVSKLSADDAALTAPDFCVLLYPVITMHSEMTHLGSKNALLGEDPSEQDVTNASLEERVTAAHPPCFLLHCSDDDSVPVNNSLHYWQALQHLGIAVEMHLFERGGHGFGLHGAKEHPVSCWPTLLHNWLLQHAK